MVGQAISQYKILGKLGRPLTSRNFVRWSSFAVLLLVPAGLGPYGPPPRPEPPKIPVAQVMREAVEAAESLPRLRSLLITSKGEPILERYFHGARASRAVNVKSVSKSVISALVGIAIERDLIPGVEAPIAPYFPHLLGPGSDPRKQAITVEDLLTMRSGLESTSGRNFGAWVASRSWVRAVLKPPLIRNPGTGMDYSTGNTHLLSTILTRVSKTSTWAFAQETLAEPLGFGLDKWPRDPEGIYRGGNDMEMTPAQMMLFGKLYLNRGWANGRQIVPEAWVDRSFVPRGRSRYSGRLYGYGWWIRRLAGRAVYYAWGYGGQFIFVVPDLETVMVVTSSTEPGRGRRIHVAGVYDLVEGVVAKLSPTRGYTVLAGRNASLDLLPYGAGRGQSPGFASRRWTIANRI